MKKILFIHQSAELYGSDKTLLVLLTHINRDKYYPVVVLPNLGILSERLDALGIEVVVAPVLKLYRDIFTIKNICRFISETFKCFKILNRLHRQHHFDIVYSNTLAVLSGGLFSRLKRIKHIWHVHEIITHPKSIATIYPKLLNLLADQIVCNSGATQDNLTSRNGALKSKSRVVFNGIEHQVKATTKVYKTDYGFEQNDIVVALVGRMSRLKGHMWLLEAFSEYLKTENQLKLLFVGSPVPGQEDYLEEVKAYLQAQNIEDKVTMIPYTERLNDLWQIIDVSVMPSIEPESFGLVAIESMLSYKPVVGANQGGLKEIIVDQETGFLIEPSNPRKLAEAIRLLAKDAALREKFGTEGYARVVANFSVQKYTSELEEVFNTI